MDISNRKLRVDLTGLLKTSYKRLDLPIPDQRSKEDIQYSDFRTTLLHGSGLNKANLQFQRRETLNNATLIYNLNGGLKNSWQDELNFNAVKLLLIKNRETTVGRILQVRFKNEIYYIGPNGFRLIGEPYMEGIQSILSSDSSEEGSIIFSTDTDITFDVVIIGSSEESSSSSGA